jgi:hypothetical protein
MSDARPPKKDLVVLVADGNAEHALKEILDRHLSLSIRPIQFEVIRDTARADPGCYGRSHEFLRPFLREFEHAIVVFDRQGSGQEARDAEELENEVTCRLRQNGWADRGAVVVIDPELEAWVWGPSREVDQTLGWYDRPARLREWLRDKGLWPAEQVKPPDPKLALETALGQLRRPRSSAIYGELAKSVSLAHCQDRSFQRLVEILRSWFPASPSSE